MGIEDKGWLNLSETEDVIWWEHPSVLMYIPRYFSGLIMALVGITAFHSDTWRNMVSGSLIYIPLVLSVFGLLYIIYSVIHRRSVYYIATTEKVIRKDGIIRRHRNPVYYNSISNVKSEESIPERIISFLVPGQDIGDIYIHTADDNLGDLRFRNVASIKEGNQSIHDMMSRNQSREGRARSQ